MIFHSLQFIFFFIVIVALYYLLPMRWRKLHLLMCGIFFYMTFAPGYILLMIPLLLADYAIGQKISTSTEKRARTFLMMSLFMNLGLLLLYKYFNFFAINITLLLNSLGCSANAPHLTVLVPIGLSFHTFQVLSYQLEIYRGNRPAEKNVLTFFLYSLFFPLIVAGPIERPGNLLPQFSKLPGWNASGVKAGLLQMAFGFFKKLVVADRLAIVADQAYGDITSQNGVTLAVATVFYAFQLYCDFSGYSDIAIGGARVMGIRVMDNFNQPYLARNIQDFWQRWHISLSTWLRDYLFSPLVIKLRNFRFGLGLPMALLITFTLCGFWHGAQWTFVVWGALHGLLLATNYLLERWIKKKKIRWVQSRGGVVITTLLTFVAVCIGWIFFRSGSLNEAWQVLSRIARLRLNEPLQLALNTVEAWFSVGLIGLVLMKERFLPTLPSRNNAVFVLMIVLLVATTYLFGVFSNQQFIYVKF